MNRLLIIIWLLTACSFYIRLALDGKGKHKISLENAEKDNAMFYLRI